MGFASNQPLREQEPLRWSIYWIKVMHKICKLIEEFFCAGVAISEQCSNQPKYYKIRVHYYDAEAFK